MCACRTQLARIMEPFALTLVVAFALLAVLLRRPAAFAPVLAFEGRPETAGIPGDDDDEMRKLLEAGLGLAFLSEPDALEQRVLVHGHDVTQAIRTPEISRGASVVSARPVVREKLLGLQRELGVQAARGAVLEGRDI